jgi:hypothetical protein
MRNEGGFAPIDGARSGRFPLLSAILTRNGEEVLNNRELRGNLPTRIAKYRHGLRSVGDRTYVRIPWSSWTRC